MLKSERYTRMMGPILDCLREAGGEAAAPDIKRKVADLVVTDLHERQQELKSGENRAENEVAWARNRLRVAGLLDGSTRGIWRLTEAGWATHLTIQEAATLPRDMKGIGPNLDGPVEEEGEGPETFNEPSVADEQENLIQILKRLPPEGFERLCQHILRKAGFEEVEVTGRTGDGGIDGHGVLLVNELVSFRVLFQCKRYQGSVGSSEMRDFRGAMSGRTDKGIFITTGTFSRDAQREALRDGVPPIELVDADKLTSLMERFQIGVKPRTVFDVDKEFFERYGLTRS